MVYEDDVVIAVAEYLKTQGWLIESMALSHQRGDDIVASRDGRRLIVEAKGEGSSKPGTRRYGAAFKPGQVDSHIGRALTRLLAVWSSGGASAALAVPDNEVHRKRVGQIMPALAELGLAVYWVDAEGGVREDGSAS